METANSKSGLDSTFLFLITLLSPVIFLPQLGGAAQFTLARHFLVVALASMWAVAAVAARGPRAILPPRGSAIAVTLFILWGIAADFAHHRPGGLWTFLLPVFLLFTLSANAPDRERARRAAENGIIAAGLIVSAYGYLHFFRIARWVHNIDWGQRTSSLFEEPNVFGIYIIFPLYWSLARLISSRGSGKKVFYTISSAACAASLFLSFSRSAWFSFGVALPVFAWAALSAVARGDRKRRIKYIAAFVVFVAAVGFLAGRLPVMQRLDFNPVARVGSALDFFNSENRVRSYIHAGTYVIIRENPLFGVGNYSSELQRVLADMYHRLHLREMYKYYSPHPSNDYLNIAALGGIPSLILYLILMLGAIAGCIAHVKKSRGSPDADSAPAYPAATIALAVQSFAFQSPLTGIVPAAHFWIPAGLAKPEAAAGTAKPAPAPIVRFACAAAVAVPLLALIWFSSIVPAVGRYHYNIAHTCRNTGCLEKGLLHADEAIKWLPRDPFSRVVKAELELKSDKPVEAIPYFLQAEKLAPYDPLLHRDIGICYAQLKQWSAAKKEFEKAIRWDPGPRARHLPMLAAAMLGTGDAKGALKALEEGVADFPNDPTLHYSLAGAYTAVRRPVEAYREAYRAVQLDPKNPIRYTRLAETLAVLGYFEEAKKAVSMALELNPNDTRARTLKAWLDHPPAKKNADSR